MTRTREVLERIFDFGLVTESEELIDSLLKERAYACVSDYAQYLNHLFDNPWEESKCIGVWFDEWYDTFIKEQ